jgi:aminoglycoside phosphotransferase (APT) family kinase protein
LSLTEQLAAYLTRVSGSPAKVLSISRISGGASRETYRFDAEIGGRTAGYILRRDPPGSLIETERRLEFEAIRSFTGKGVAAPEALWLETDGAELERPFFIMARIDGGQTGGAFGTDPYGEHAAAIGRQFFTFLGKIAGEPVENLPIMSVTRMPAPQDCWRQQLDYWAGVIDEDEIHPQPIVRAAIRKLRASPPPPPAKIAVVHGDYRTGNFLHDGAGKIVAVLDWEMAHLGDPLEDIGWASDPLWSNPADHRVSGMTPLAEGLALWEQASGLKVDPRGLAWWSLFASVKAQAIWISSAKEWRDGGYREPILAFSGWFTARRQDQILAKRLAEWEAL